VPKSHNHDQNSRRIADRKPTGPSESVAQEEVDTQIGQLTSDEKRYFLARRIRKDECGDKTVRNPDTGLRSDSQ
jgi:hypothetical protein